MDTWSQTTKQHGKRATPIETILAGKCAIADAWQLPTSKEAVVHGFFLPQLEQRHVAYMGNDSHGRQGLFRYQW